jgi:hypothetical protein
MKRILFAVLMIMSSSAMAYDWQNKSKENQTVNLEFNSLGGLNSNQVQVAVATVCIEGKLFAVAVQKDSSSKNTGGVALTQVMELNGNGKMAHVNCNSKK